MDDRAKAARKAIAALNEFLIAADEGAGLWEDDERLVRSTLALLQPYADAPRRG